MIIRSVRAKIEPRFRLPARLCCVERLEEDFKVRVRIFNDRNFRLAELGDRKTFLGKLARYF